MRHDPQLENRAHSHTAGVENKSDQRVPLLPRLLLLSDQNTTKQRVKNAKERLFGKLSALRFMLLTRGWTWGHLRGNGTRPMHALCFIVFFSLLCIPYGVLELLRTDRSACSSASNPFGSREDAERENGRQELTETKDGKGW